MTQTNTDYLLQIAPAATDRTYGLPAGNDSGGNFDDHLSQFRTSPVNDFQTRSGVQRSEKDRYERDDQPSNTSDSRQVNQDGDASARAQSSHSGQDDTADAVNRSRPSTKQSDNEEHE